MATYIDLVNFALRESGSTLDQLVYNPPTTDTWTSPSDPLYTKFRQWVKQAWVDIQTERRDWEYMQESATVLLNPAMEVYGADGPNNNVSDFAGTVFRLHNSANAAFMTGSSLTIVDGAFADGDVEGLLKVTFSGYDGDFYIEPGDLITDSTGLTTAYFKRWGRYDLTQTGSNGRDEVDDLAEIKVDSVAISDLQFASGQSYSSVTYDRLEFVPYNKWLRYGYDRPKRIGKPVKFTVSNNGKLEFYPPLDTTYNLFFEYTKTPQEFSAATDTPTGLPSRFHDAIAWRALLYYGQFDGINRIAQIASERYKKMEYEMVRDLLPETKVGYDARRW